MRLGQLFSRKYAYVFLALVVCCLHNAWAQTGFSSRNDVYIMGTNIPPDDISKIIKALPDKPMVTPKKQRNLLIFDLNVNYGGHRSAAYANVAFKLIGEKTGAFKTVISSDPAVFERDSLNRFDAVFFNNNVGILFTNRDLRGNLIEFLYSGKGLMGVHGTSVAFTKWPGAVEDWGEFGIAIGARGANHRESMELVTVKIDDVFHPLNQVFNGKPFEYRDEFFRFHEVYSRERLRVLLSIDTNRIDLNLSKNYGSTIRKDHDYALAWVRNYGRGRVFYSTIAHNPYVFYDALMLRFYLGAAQFALGDLDAPTTPSAKLSDFVRDLEKMKWNVGILMELSGDFSIEDIAERASNRGLLQICASYGSRIFRDGDSKFNYGLSSLEREKFRLILDRYGVRLTACCLNQAPDDEREARKLVEFLNVMGIELIVIKEYSKAMVNLVSLAKSFDIKTAFNCEEKEEKRLLSIKEIGECNGDIGFLLCGDKNVLKELNERGDLLKDRFFGVSFSYQSNRDSMFEILGIMRKHKISGVYIWVRDEGKQTEQLLEDVKKSVKNAVLGR